MSENTDAVDGAAAKAAPAPPGAAAAPPGPAPTPPGPTAAPPGPAPTPPAPPGWDPAAWQAHQLRKQRSASGAWSLAPLGWAER
ncbi:hypothetical protein J7E97_10715, partial [Streptomyces sp. ISL-66]|uniref:hypothetical protein n=1 Tax=Streptomyces sp. ISL-66 TaxID=2819186 RepID=UPI001BE59174